MRASHAASAFFICALRINGAHYLGVANHRNGASFNIDSKIYRWDGASFVEFQSLATNGARGLEFFTIDGAHSLFISNQLSDSTVCTLTFTTTMTRTATSTSSTTTRTERPSSLESSQFAFTDAGAWTLGFLALYLGAIGGVVLMVHLWAKTGTPTKQPDILGRPTAEDLEPQYPQEHAALRHPNPAKEAEAPGKASPEEM